MIELQSENVRLRPLEMKDKVRLTDLANNEKISINLTDAFPHPYHLKDAEAFLGKCLGQDPVTLFAIEFEGKYVGNIGLVKGVDVYRKSAVIGYFLGEPYWNKGIMTHAVNLITNYGFTHLDVERIHTGIFDFNHASQRVLEKCGFLKEGVFKRAIIKKGEMYDEIRYAKLKTNLQVHWNKTYERNPIDKLGWFEENPETSLQLIEKCKLSKHAAILNIGAGATTLVDELLKEGYNNIIANDISKAALEKLKARIGEEESNKVKWIVDDVTNPTELNQLEPVDLWHDRAVLHFFTEKADQDAYFELLKKLLKLRGYVIIAAFNLEGATKCSGLPIFRYDKNMLQEKLGPDIELIEAFDYTYTMPSGQTRAYVYTLFQSVN